MAVPAPKPHVTIADYLRMEEQATDRHEYHDGEVLAMSGGTYRHSRINTQLIVALGKRLQGGPCVVLDSNMRVAVAATRRYFYPDTTVVCGGPQFDPNDTKQTTITNPRVVFEVLSETTEAYDRGEKFNHYRELESLQEYVLVSQARPMVEAFVRQPDGTWLFDAWQGADAVARLRSLELELPLTELYADLSWDEPAGAAATAGAATPVKDQEDG